MAATAAQSTYILTEGHALAKPLIEALGLKRSEDQGMLRLFAGEAVLLAESRGGAHAAAAAVGYLLGRYGCGPRSFLLHLGRSMPSGRACAELLGRLVLVNRVRDDASARCYYPDLLLTHPFPEAGVHTSSARAGAEEPGDANGWPLRDEELAGVLAAALAFLAPHQVVCLEAVVAVPGSAAVAAGAALESPAVGWAEEGEIVAAEMGAVERLLASAAELLRPAGPALDQRLRGAVDAIAAALRLTATQSGQLRRLAEGAMLRGGDVAAVLSGWDRGAPLQSKQERNRRFDELKRALEA